MFDSVVIGKKDSYFDYEASMKEREIGDPKKKIIKETVPFSNITYDFTKINGEIYWEERVLTYVFEITADSPEELEVKKQAFKRWIMNVHEEELHDPYIKDFHFIATFDDIACDDTEIEKSTITVTFTAYPYMIADKKKIYTAHLENEDAVELVVFNNSSHRIVATLKTDVNCSVSSGDSGIFISDNADIYLETGRHVFNVARLKEQNGTVSLEFYEEVF